eukprot:9460203-Pyramimonas_sp.AAC.1
MHLYYPNRHQGIRSRGGDGSSLAHATWFIQDISRGDWIANPQTIDDVAAQQPIAVIEEITSMKEEGTEDGPGGDQQPATPQPGPPSGSNTGEIME